MKAPLSTFTNTEFNVLTDHPEVIKHVCSIVLVAQNNECTHYSVGPNDEGHDTLTLYHCESPGAAALPFPMTTAEELALFIGNWCRRSAKYNVAEYGGDGDEERGVRLQSSNNWKVLVEASAEYVYYGK